MSLSNKYNVPKETIDRMVKDGVISTSWPAYEEMYNMFKNSMSMGKKCKNDVYIEIAEAKRVSPDTVRYAVNKFGKNS